MHRSVQLTVEEVLASNLNLAGRLALSKDHTKVLAEYLECIDVHRGVNCRIAPQSQFLEFDNDFHLTAESKRCTLTNPNFLRYVLIVILIQQCIAKVVCTARMIFSLYSAIPRHSGRASR